MKTLLALLLLIPSLSISEVNKKNEQSSSDITDIVIEKYYDEILDFAVSNSVSTLIHEVGHYYIDILDIPTFGQEEDMADSFITMYLIHKPEQYGDDYEAYEYYSLHDHNYIKGIVNNFFYLMLLGRDVEYVSGMHSNDKKRFYNIICSMKDANPDVFKEFVSSRDINYELDYDCQEGVHTDIWNSWSKYLTGMWHGDGVEYIGKFILNYQDPIIDDQGETDIYPELLKIEIERVSERLFDDFHIQLPTDLNINFRYCDGEKNAFYYPGYYEIDFCYELFKEHMLTALDIYILKENL